MDPSILAYLIICIFTVAILYSCVGHGGASGYIAAMTILGLTPMFIKPTALMRYLCRLVTPERGTVLDPFAGSGSTGKAAALEGFGFIGFELDPEYAALAKARIEQALRGRGNGATAFDLGEESSAAA